MDSYLIPVADVKDLPSGGRIGTEVNGEKIAIYNVDGEFFAISSICPHEGGPLERGRLEGYALTCPWHLWTFDIRTGQWDADPSVCVRSYQVQVKEGKVFIDLTEDHESALKWGRILTAIESGEDIHEVSKKSEVPLKEIEEAIRKNRIGERLIWLGNLYREKGAIGAMDLLRMPKRDVKKLSYQVITLLDDLTNLL